MGYLVFDVYYLNFKIFWITEKGIVFLQQPFLLPFHLKMKGLIFNWMMRQQTELICNLSDSQILIVEKLAAEIPTLISPPTTTTTFHYRIC